ncbi:hypothetical protein HN51_051992 [Arachis hypogaea]
MAKLEAKLGMIVDSVGNFFSGKDQLLWCDPDIVAIEEGRAVVVLQSPGAGIGSELWYQRGRAPPPWLGTKKGREVPLLLSCDRVLN